MPVRAERAELTDDNTSRYLVEREHNRKRLQRPRAWVARRDGDGWNVGARSGSAHAAAHAARGIRIFRQLRHVQRGVDVNCRPRLCVDCGGDRRCNGHLITTRCAIVQTARVEQLLAENAC